MSEEKKDGETVKKVGTIAYAAYEDAATFDWTQVTVWPLCRVLRVACPVRRPLSLSARCPKGRRGRGG